MSQQPVRITIEPGANTLFSVTWPVGFDFTGYHVEAYEPEKSLRGKVTFTVAGRVVSGKIEWDHRFPRKEALPFNLRLRTTPLTGDPVSIPFEAYVTR